MSMRTPPRMPALNRRSRTLIAIAAVVVALLIIGPRFIDTYVDWLWFGELGYRSVFTTVLFTRLAVFAVAALIVGAIVFAGLALAYRTRPVFVPTVGPTDPVARYRTAVMSKLKTFGFGVPTVVGLLAGLIAQSYWPTIQLFFHGGAFGITDPQFGKDLGFYAFDLPFYRMVLSFIFAAVFLAFLANLVTHYIFGGIRLAAGSAAYTSRRALFTERPRMFTASTRRSAWNSRWPVRLSITTRRASATTSAPRNPAEGAGGNSVMPRGAVKRDESRTARTKAPARVVSKRKSAPLSGSETHSRPPRAALNASPCGLKQDGP